MKQSLYHNKGTEKETIEGVSEENIGVDSSSVSLSIVITVNDECKELEKNLPLFLSQNYDAPYEVIVVIDKGANDIEDILKRYKDYHNLYYTFIPQSSRYMSRKKLKITLGVKAAKHEWIVMTEPTVEPNDNNWLKNFTKDFDKNTNAVMGITILNDEATDYQRFEECRTMIYASKKIIKKQGYRCPTPLLAFRKSLFMSDDGFRNNQKYLRGEYDFILNEYRKKSKIAYLKEALAKEDAPTNKEWTNKHMFYQETRKHLKGSFKYRIWFNIEQTMLHLAFCLLIISLCLSCMLKSWILSGSTVALLITLLTSRTIVAKKALKKFDIYISAFKLPFFELSIVWINLWWKLKYNRANKTDFISHKI